MSLARLLWPRADAAPSRFTGLKTGAGNGNTAVSKPFLTSALSKIYSATLF